MKSKATSIYCCIAALGALLTCAWGCDNSDSRVEARYHSITTAPNADCKIDVKAQEIAGEEVLATVTLLNETVDIASVTYNDKPCDPVSEGGGILCSRIASPCPLRV